MSDEPIIIDPFGGVSEVAFLRDLESAVARHISTDGIDAKERFRRVARLGGIYGGRFVEVLYALGHRTPEQIREQFEVVLEGALLEIARKEKERRDRGETGKVTR